MTGPNTPDPARQRSGRMSAILLLIVAVCAVAGFVLLKTRRQAQPPYREQPAVVTPAPAAPAVVASSNAPIAPEPAPAQPPRPAAQELTAAEVVSNKLAQFTRHRREILQTMARQLSINVPSQIQQYFDAAEGGDWEETDTRFRALRDRVKSTADDASDAINKLWGPILSVYGAAEQAHKWPAKQLLDYGHAVIGSFRPGTVYFGGTDEGRFIPELLSETSESRQHVVLTQNALADGSYLGFVRSLYSDRMNALTADDSQKAFQEYLSDAQKRFVHDRDFPNEPRQLRAGETIKMDGNKVQVSGSVAVMALNEKLVQVLMEKNPDRPFALQESFPLRKTYANAVPLGPIVEIGVKDARDRFTAERAAETVKFWRNTAEQLAKDAEASASAETMKSYAKLANGQGNLLADWQYLAEAEEAYRLSSQMWPGNIESMGSLAELFIRTGRAAEGNALLDEFERKFPDQAKDVERTRNRLRNVRVSPQFRK